MSVLSANSKKCRFCNFSGSYTKRSPSEKWSWAKTYSVIVTGASWVHFNPRKTKIGQKKSLTPFFHRDLQFWPEILEANIEAAGESPSVPTFYVLYMQCSR